MRRLWLPLVLLLIACRALVPTSVPSALPPTASPYLKTPTPYTLTPTSTFSFPSPSPLSPTPYKLTPTSYALTPTSSRSPQTPSPQTPFVRLHPDGSLYVGDQVSLEVIAPQGADVADHKVQVQIDGPMGKALVPVDFGEYGIAGRSQATLLWAWDTAGLQAGEHTLTFSLLPGDLTWTETVSLLPQADVPAPEPQAHWATAESDCCVVYYITGTDAERDLQTLLDKADEQANDASQRLHINLTEPIPVVFLPRVLGHGGFAAEEISVSYLDRNYAGVDPAMVLHHEMVHVMDGRLGGELRPNMLLEGVAVYLTGGHFKPEPLLPRAATLLSPLDRYIPLVSLADNFYFSQHEIGYLEAGALIEFLVNTWGWEAFDSFYRDIHPQPDGSQSQAIDVALKAHFNLSLVELEERFQEALHKEPLVSQNVQDVRLTVDYFDMVRRYQQMLDPSAYFLTAWLPDAKQMRERGIVADYLRHPSELENLTLEDLLVAAGKKLRSGDYNQTELLLKIIGASLDSISPTDFKSASN